jgi:hypothetical protein
MNLRNNISIRFVVFLSVIAGVLPSCNSKPLPKVEKEIHKIEAPSIPELPAEVVFADQKIILKDEDVIERLDREVLVNAYFQSATIQQLKRANRWFPTIERILKEEGVPTDFKYLAVIESGLVQAVSPAGAQGFWQFMPGTAKEYDLVVNKEIDERLHIEKSTRAACKYLKASHAEFNDWLLAAASYNRGVGGVKQDMGWQGTKHYFDTDQNSETGRYVFRILAVKLIFENPEAYGFPIRKMKLYKPFATKSVEVKESIPNLAKWALQQGINFKILTKLNPWLKTNKLTVKNTKIEIILPSESENLKPYEAYL